ncbi:unnamed protein product [Prunus armeniaca]
MYDVCNYDAYFVQKCDAIGVLGLFLKQKLTTSLQMLAFGAFAHQVDEIARMGKSIILESLVRFYDTIETLYMKDCLCKPTPRDVQRLLQKAEARGYPCIIGNINCMLTRIYERPIGANEQLLEHEPLVRDGHYNNLIIDRYTEMQSSYIHE